MSESKIKIDTEKLDKLIRSLTKKSYIEIGVLEGGTHGDSDKSTAYIGSVHEFGTDRAGRGNKVVIPARSFLKMPLEKKAKTIQKFAEKNLEEDLANGDILKILNRMGVGSVSVVQEAFETGGFGEWPDIEEATKKQKGRSAILIDEALLKKSITYKIRGKV